MSHINLAGIEMEYNLGRYESPEESRNKQESIIDEDDGINDAIRLSYRVPYYPAIHWLCQNDADVTITIPEISRIIQTKWEKCGYSGFVLGFYLDSLIVVLITFIIIMVNSNPTVNPRHGSEMAMNFVYPLLVVIFFFMFCQDAYILMAMKTKYFSVSGIAFFNIICRAVKIISFAVFCCIRTSVSFENRGNHYFDGDDMNPTSYYLPTNDPPAMKIFLVICTMTCWVHIYYYLLGFDSTGKVFIHIHI